MRALVAVAGSLLFVGRAGLAVSASPSLLFFGSGGFFWRGRGRGRKDFSLEGHPAPSRSLKKKICGRFGALATP